MSHPSPETPLDPALPAWSVLHADWLDAAPTLPAAAVHLLYADPPFNTGRRQRTPPGAARAGRRVHAAFDDALGTPDQVIAWLSARLSVSLPALAPSANIIIHVDWRTAHHVRLLLDRLLGPDRFVNHLIWSYGLGGSSPRAFARKHDDLLLYCLDPRHAFFDPPRVPATSRRLAGRTKKATDVLDIPALNNMARERTGYPTQKPLALLDILVRACTPIGGLVLDPCCGSGTTLVAARAADRRAIGFDINPDAVALARRRLSVAQSPR